MMSESREGAKKANPDDMWADLQTGNLDDILEYVEDFVDMMGTDLDVELERERDALVVNLIGPDSQMLLDYGGEVLDAMQVVLGKILPRKFGTTLRVLMDADGFRVAHERELIELARRLADKVRETGEHEELSPMNSMERRIVHMALSNEEGVVTESTGEGDIRRVQILPEQAAEAGN
jgi:spoIIIJ-associated protein